MTNRDPGNETHSDGDYKSFPDDGTASVGEPVALDGAGNITAAGEGDSIVGVYYSEGEPGNDKASVKMQGTVVARVDSAVTEGTYLGSPNTSATDPEEDNALGTFDDQGFLALEDAQGDYDDTSDSHAEVLLR